MVKRLYICIKAVYCKLLKKEGSWSALLSRKVVAFFPGVIPYIIDELRPVPLARACSSCFIPDPTSLCSVRSLIFYSMLHPRPNLTLFDPTSLCLVRSLYFKLNAKSQTQPHSVWLGPCISNSMPSPRPNLTLFG
ncbi:hypothetical protein E4T56_gene18352 [Termitomyces sp. T112]|nr:hypothetical protein E4T56_gene18352 [Termitomyces sp. T112]